MRKYYICNKDELYHHGVLGMKWGVRRYQPYSSTSRRKSGPGKEVGLAKKRSSLNKKNSSIGSRLKSAGGTIVRVSKGTVKAGKKAYSVGKNLYTEYKEKEKRKIIDSGDPKKVYKERRKLSNGELNEALNRINTENKVKELGKSPLRLTLEKGRDKVGDALADSGGILVKSAAIAYGSYHIKKKFKAGSGGDDLANEFVNPLKKKK